MAYAYPYRYHVALDGAGLNGLEGLAGVCAFHYQPADGSYAYKVRYFDGAAAGHAVSLNPAATVGFLGNAAQHLLFYDAATLEELERISTLRFESVDTSLQGSTHLIWLSDSRFITAIGRHFYRFDLADLSRPERLRAHEVKLPHAMKLSASGRYLCFGSMDNPADGRDGEARQLGIWDLVKDELNVIRLPATCWHVAPHPTEDLFYAVSFRVAPGDGDNWHEWGMAYLKEYAFEIDPAEPAVRRHWAAGRDIPAHINSDICVSDRELIFCNGGSASIVCVDLDSFAGYRVIDARPDLKDALTRPREMARTVVDSLSRGNLFTNSRHFVAALQVSHGSLLDSIYGCQLSADRSLLFTANRGLNQIVVYDYPSGAVRNRIDMPELQTYLPDLPPLADPRLGFHHSCLVG
jgi:hypothetical protein